MARVADAVLVLVVAPDFDVWAVATIEYVPGAAVTGSVVTTVTVLQGPTCPIEVVARSEDEAKD